MLRKGKGGRGTVGRDEASLLYAVVFLWSHRSLIGTTGPVRMYLDIDLVIEEVLKSCPLLFLVDWWYTFAHMARFGRRSTPINSWI